jgi:hypothetical protein
MNQQPCHLCSATALRIRQTPTLFGVRQLCARCRDRYRAVVVGAIGEFHLHQQRTPSPDLSPSREAA